MRAGDVNRVVRALERSGDPAAFAAFAAFAPRDGRTREESSGTLEFVMIDGRLGFEFTTEVGLGADEVGPNDDIELITQGFSWP